VFDNEILAQILHAGYEIGEVTCPTRYFEEASSIRLRAGIGYAIGVVRVSLTYFLHKHGIIRSRLFTAATRVPAPRV
jgi:hypothetical protein